MKLFDFINSICLKKGKPTSEMIDLYYDPFLVNRTFSYFEDTLFLANEMNRSRGLSKIMNFDFFYEMTNPKKRFINWYKGDKDTQEKIDILKKAYGYSTFRAKETIPLIDELDLWESLKKDISIGGVSV